jgi:TPR repeat protein
MARLTTAVLALVFVSWSAGQALAGPDDEGIKAFLAGDYATALNELEPLAEQGFSGAQYYLGEMYREGKGVPQSYDKAISLFSDAAEGNKPYPQYRLGTFYEAGTGVAIDLTAAYMWYDLSAILGYSSGAKKRDLLSSKMTPASIEKAKNMAKEWLQDHKSLSR